MERKIKLEVYEELLNHATDAIVIVGEDHRILHSNGGVETIFGWRPEELIGEHLDILIPESVRAGHGAEMRSFASGAPKARRMGERSSVFGRHRAGHLVPLDISLIVRNFDGAPVYVAIARDISGLREKEEALHRSEARLRHSQRIARMGSWDVDMKAGVLSWSDEVYEIFGIDKQGFEPSFDAFLEYVHPEDREMVAAASEAAQAGDGHYATDHRIVLADGEVRYVHEEAVVLYDDEGMPSSMQGIVQDITKRKQDENALRQMRNEALTASAAKSRFLAMMSHELRTPLNAIIGFSEMMRSAVFGPLGSDNYEGYAKDIHFSGKHLLSIVEEILDVTRIENEEIVKSESAFPVAPLVEETVRLTDPESMNGNSRIEIAGVVEGLLLLADRRMIQQSLSNLLRNALKFSPDSTPILVLAEIDRKSGEVALRVRDHGIGIPASELDNLTQPFYMLDDPEIRESQQGFGLGLYIVRRFIEAHGGRFVITSEIGGETEASIIFPAERLVSQS